jgi:hypothetical protein
MSFIIFAQTNIRMVKSRRIRGKGHLSLLGGMRNLFKSLRGRYGNKMGVQY